jgi:hypothetical protein
VAGEVLAVAALAVGVGGHCERVRGGTAAATGARRRATPCFTSTLGEGMGRGHGGGVCECVGEGVRVLVCVVHVAYGAVGGVLVLVCVCVCVRQAP